MLIIEPSFEVLDFPENAIDKIANSARVCYQSEPKGEKSNENLVRKLIASGHHTPLEHCIATVRIITDRGVMAELTRHRLASFNIESTRYVNHSKKDIEFIKPCFWSEDDEKYVLWKQFVDYAEAYYKDLIECGATPEQARSVLPNSLKTEIIMTCNLRELRHILDLRCSAKAHPQIKEIMIPLLEECYKRLPVIFEDIYLKYCSK
jgi:thymidylate synthase (FAD)